MAWGIINLIWTTSHNRRQGQHGFMPPLSWPSERSWVQTMPIITTHRILTVLLSGSLLILAGCSSSNKESGFNNETGKHVENWYVDHRAAFLDNPALCAQCHGTDLKGGLSNVSCFSASFSGMSCHANGPSNHPSDWDNPDIHGATAKAAPSTTSGFSLCQTCHGSDFAGGTIQKTCLNTAGCHGANVNAPHSPKPWRNSIRTHANTNPDNAPVCALCHLGKRTPPSYAAIPAGTTPGCFNNTLCHAAVGHPAGWADPNAHGATAKAAPGTTSGFSLCQTCHGNDFTGGAVLQTCLNTAGCHGAGVNAPHAAAWLPGSAYVHTTTDPGNALVCALCHLGNRTPPSYATVPVGTTPGCFNNTLCHATVGHPAGWEDPNAHGEAAKKAPNAATTSGFSICQNCHGNNFIGGISLQTCLNTAGCHGANVNSPHSPKPWRGTLRTHTSTDQANASVCSLCHTTGANSSVLHFTTAPAGTTPGCFNNKLCHADPSGWSLPASHGATAKAAPSTTSGFSLCRTCHGSDFTGGTALQTCLNTAGCHGAGINAPHSPKPWKDSARTHTTTNPNNASVCATCHTNGANSTVQPSPYDPLAAPGCFNNTLCHANVGAPHAVPFTDPALHGPPAKADLTYCQACHANPSNGGAGSNPRFNVTIGSLTNGCEDCHDAYTAHPVPSWKWENATFTGHQKAGNMANACALCHGVNLVGGNGPSCSACHTAGSPLTQANCTSCHGKPPTGTAFPNIAGKHGKHNALANVTGVCNICHNGAGTNTVNHDYGSGVVNIAFLGTTYNAKTGSAGYNADFTCSNISCHGGQTTPSWLTGTINVNTQCKSCHASGTTQYNGYNSGQHSDHSSYDCFECHDTTKLVAVHFNDLNTSSMSEAWKTIISGANYTGTGGGTFGNCTITCHGETHTNRAWQ